MGVWTRTVKNAIWINVASIQDGNRNNHDDNIVEDENLDESGSESDNKLFDD